MTGAIALTPRFPTHTRIERKRPPDEREAVSIRADDGNRTRILSLGS